MFQRNRCMRNVIRFSIFLQNVEFHTTKISFCCSSIGPQKSVLINTLIFVCTVTVTSSTYSKLNRKKFREFSVQFLRDYFTFFFRKMIFTNILGNFLKASWNLLKGLRKFPEIQAVLKILPNKRLRTFWKQFLQSKHMSIVFI